MHKFRILLIAAGCWLAFAAHAQDTNELKTEIGIFESQTGVVVVKGFGEVGSVAAGMATISVRAKQSMSIATGHKDFGLAVVIEGNQWRQIAFVDADELGALLSGLDYLGKINYGVTSLPGFEASFTTKSGLQFIAFGSKRQSSIQTFLQYNDGPRIPLSSNQWLQLSNLLDQAKSALDSLRAPK